MLRTRIQPKLKDILVPQRVLRTSFKDWRDKIPGPLGGVSETSSCFLFISSIASPLSSSSISPPHSQPRHKRTVNAHPDPIQCPILYFHSVRMHLPQMKPRWPLLPLGRGLGMWRGITDICAQCGFRPSRRSGAASGRYCRR